MYIELHLLQNFAPSCLNRDDTNTPKDCEFGGYRRARISSQCVKRAVRRHFADQKLLPPEHLAERSKRLIGEVVKRLVERERDANSATGAVKMALASVKLAADDKNETQYLLFLGCSEIAALADVVNAHWDALAAIALPAPEQTGEDAAKRGKGKTGKQKKSEAREAVPAEVAKQVKALFNGGKAVDVALFGRMLADQAGLNVDAACQVAHALSTNKVSMEMDFYTAVDDLKQRDDSEDAGAGMLGTVEYNSACFYRYANINFKQLVENLQNDAELARRAVEAFLQAFVAAIPTGKQNTFAAHNPPSLVLVTVRDRGLYSLANAFERPVRPDRNGGLVQNSIRELDTYWGQLTRMFGADGLRVAKVCIDDEALELKSLLPHRVASVRAVLDAALAELPGDKEGT